MRWEQKLANQAEQWSPDAPAGGDVTIEGDEITEEIVEYSNSPLDEIRKTAELG